MSSQRNILVVGATGKQGSAVIRSLKSHAQFNEQKDALYALTRNANSSSAASLKSQGVKVVQGDLLSHDSLAKALQSINVAFLVTDAFSKGGVENEVKQGKTFIDAAKQAGVEYIVFSSVGSADVATSVPHFASKFEIEKHLRASGIKWAIVRPVAYMDNIAPSGIGRFIGLSLFGSLMGNKKLQYIAVDDIGRVAAECILQPQQYQGEVIELAGDDITVPQIQNAWQRGTGVFPWKMWLPRSLLLFILPYDLRMMFKFFVSNGYRANITSLRRKFPGLKDFEAWTRDQAALSRKQA